MFLLFFWLEQIVNEAHLSVHFQPRALLWHLKPHRVSLQSQCCSGRLGSLGLLHRRQSSGAVLFNAAVWRVSLHLKEQEKGCRGSEHFAYGEFNSVLYICQLQCPPPGCTFQLGLLASLTAAVNKSALLTSGFALGLHTNERCIYQRSVPTTLTKGRKIYHWEEKWKEKNPNMFHFNCILCISFLFGIWWPMLFWHQTSRGNQKVDTK